MGWKDWETESDDKGGKKYRKLDSQANMSGVEVTDNET